MGAFIPHQGFVLLMVKPRPRPRPRLRTAYLERADGVIQRYKTRRPKGTIENEVTKAAYDRQRRENRGLRLERARARRGLKKLTRARRVQETARKPSGRVPEHMLEYRTIFRAAGTSTPGLSPPHDPFGFYPDDNSQPPPGFETGPNYFYSNAFITGGLGQVVWAGIKPLADLIDELNAQLGITDKSGRARDFRSAYKRWSFRYIVIEKLKTGGGDRIVEDKKKSGGL